MSCLERNSINTRSLVVTMQVLHLNANSFQHLLLERCSGLSRLVWPALLPPGSAPRKVRTLCLGHSCKQCGMQSAHYFVSCVLLDFTSVWRALLRGLVQQAPIIEQLVVGGCDKLPRSTVQQLKRAASVVVPDPDWSTDEE